MQANLRPKHEWEGGAAAPFLLQNAKNLRRIPAAVPSATKQQWESRWIGAKQNETVSYIHIIEKITYFGQKVTVPGQ